MSIDKIARMKELVSTLQRAAYAYEQEDTEIMSNRMMRYMMNL